MKATKYIASILLVFVLGSCGDDFLEIKPQDKVTTDTFYKSEDEIRAGTASLYGLPWFDFNSSFFWLAGDAMSGNLYYTYDQEGQFFYLTFNNGNAYLKGGWNSLYRVISYSNSIIENMPGVASSAGVSQEVINRALGEARFMRGTAYYILAEFWGEVPIVENTSELISANNLMLQKNTQNSVYEFARRDLDFAAHNLPSTDVAGRVTSWSAKGMLAKLHLTIGQFNKSDADFELAKQYASDVINNSSYQLLDNYADLFDIENNNNAESLFALQFIAGSYGTGNNRQANWARNSIITGNTEAWGGGKSVTYDFIQEMEPDDARRSSIYMSIGDYYPEIRKAEGGYTYNHVTRDGDGKQIEDPGPVLNHLKKYIVGSSKDTDGKVTTNQSVAINQYILRLADVYLIYAEAELGLDGSTSNGTALGYLNKIRERAGLAPKSSITFADILHERRMELGMESLYWFDLKRFYYRDPAAAIANLNAQERGHTYYRDSSPTAADENTNEGYILSIPESPVVVFESDMMLPIPVADVTFNPSLAPEADAVEYTFND